MISTTEMPARDITANTRAAMPTMPFMPGPETLIIAMLFRLVIPFTGIASSVLSLPISVPGPAGWRCFNQARDLELGNRRDGARVQHFGAEVGELHRLLVRHRFQQPGVRHGARIAGIHAVDVGPDPQQSARRQAASTAAE